MFTSVSAFGLLPSPASSNPSSTHLYVTSAVRLHSTEADLGTKRKVDEITSISVEGVK